MAKKPVGLEKIDISEVRKICEKQGLKPGRVKGTEGVQFTKGRNPNVEVLSWEDFETAIKARRLAVYASKPSTKGKYKGRRFMKVLKR